MAIEALSKIIERIEAAKTVDEQTALLLKHSSTSLKNIVGFGMNPNTKWLLPEGAPPFKPAAKASDYEGGLYKECRKFIYFVASQEGLQVKQLKREQLFIQMLENIDPDDALLVLRVKDKKLKINPEAVKKAFPKLTIGW